MKKLILIVPLLLSGCAIFQEPGAKQQDAELNNNKAEVEHAQREICKQIRAAVLADVYGDDLAGWHSFCRYE